MKGGADGKGGWKRRRVLLSSLGARIGWGNGRSQLAQFPLLSI